MVDEDEVMKATTRFSLARHDMKRYHRLREVIYPNDRESAREEITAVIESP
ncbi:hypothetical protein [Haloarcula nitratireducens]|uniref:Uncharacterized protein n=1 Tax=Haloarcula nitratireducens TaxID=2487749 RepID=A0AAW4PHY7_9EURY|nr:hypothetical protein [Halomicroarcula nitratireducens]MBX0297449.1 hypothetical protein [Halomicroarcula nitratireducens]